VRPTWGNIMKIAYFDCFSGISGDMVLGALLDCLPQADRERFLVAIKSLKLDGYSITLEHVNRSGIEATHARVLLSDAPAAAPKHHHDGHDHDHNHDHHDAHEHGHEHEHEHHGRSLRDIRELIEASPLSESVKSTAVRIFEKLAQAEGKIHGKAPDEVHFHEVGAVDSIVDIVGAAILLDMHGIEKVIASKIPCGRGLVRCQHGLMPIPAPATLAVLGGFPLYGVDLEGELVTPTGAAIVAALADPSECGRFPAMSPIASGFGSGTKKFAWETPNLLRVVIGQSDSAQSASQIAVLETNIDNRTPEALGFAMETLLAAGALDVYFTPIQMKKNRPAIALSVLCLPEAADALSAIIFRHTGSLGLRKRLVERVVLERKWVLAQTPFGDVRVKIGSFAGEPIAYSAEYEDAKNAAIAHNVPLETVCQAALAVVRA